MAELNAFNVLQELAQYTAILKESVGNVENLRAGSAVMRARAETMVLGRPRAALRRVADALEEAVRSLEDLRAIVDEEGKIVKERLEKAAITEHDLDEIHRRRAQGAKEREKAKERPTPTIAVAWTTRTSS